MRRIILASLLVVAACQCGGDPDEPRPGSPASIALSGTSVSLAGKAGSEAAATSVVTIANGGGASLAVPTVTVTYAGDAAGWLTAVVSGAAAPYTLTLEASAAALGPGQYAATVSVACAAASDSPRSVDVTFTVGPAEPPAPPPPPPTPALSLSRSSVAMTGVTAAAGDAEVVQIANSGGGTLALPAATVTYAGAGPEWLTADVSEAGSAYTLTLTASAAALQPGQYAATVSLASAGASNTPQAVHVTFTVEPPPLLAVSTSEVMFTAARGGANPAPKTVTVTNAGGGSLPLPAVSVAYAAGADWLVATGPGGTAPYQIELQPVTAGLAAGTYTATLSVASAGVSNSPQTVAVSFAVSTVSCVPEGTPCANQSIACCSGVCSTDTGQCTPSLFCAEVGAPCDAQKPNACCTVACVGGFCAVEMCRAQGQSCDAAHPCCSGTCASGTCQPVPVPSGTSLCGTIGERCAAGAECCSKNCQGGFCAVAYSCQAYDDICYADTECCSGSCNLTASTQGMPGRCEKLTGAGGGSCDQGGTPCLNGASNCCSRLCVDLGSGVPVCQPAGGCRMTGDYCDANPDCCNLNDDPRTQVSQYVLCEANRCNNGGSCNPPGNICGAGDANASQNCCDGKTKVCKPDSNGIWRCFGGGQVPGCDTGYDASNPACCIDEGQICQFRDQCCNFAPCVPASDGKLRCTAASTPECLPPNAPCTAGGTPCCGDEACPVSGFCAWGACTANGQTCSVGGDCCSGACSGGVCSAPCQGAGLACTTGTDCCSGLSCSIPQGQTSGTCWAATCAEVTAPCSANLPCCATDATCKTLDGSASCPADGSAACSCQTPLAACQEASGSCGAQTACCDGLLCVDVQGAACATASSCFCSACTTNTGTCTRNDECCSGLCAIAAGQSQGTCVPLPADCSGADAPCSGTQSCCEAFQCQKVSSTTTCDDTSGCRCSSS